MLFDSDTILFNLTSCLLNPSFHFKIFKFKLFEALSLSLVQILFHQISCLLLLTRLSCSLFFVILYQSVTLTYAIFFILSGTERAILDLNYHDLFFILTSTQEDDDG